MLCFLGKSAFIFRILDTTSGINNFGQKTINPSSYSIILQAKVAYTNFKEHPIIGSGLGSHLIAFNKYYNMFHYDNMQPLLHKSDAASLFLRILSELGFFGIILLLFYLIYFNTLYISKNNLNLNILLNHACLIFIILRLIRCGVYYADGFFIFALMYCFSKQKFLEEQKNESIK